ncbi:MAG TPA: hypothetical protein PKV72_03455 [Candidatus Peribacteria bacterium]|nr:hypothetical protein [Candidatus Peribacteria bacterium]
MPLLVLAALCVAWTCPPAARAEGINYDEDSNQAFFTIDEPFGGTYDLGVRFGGTLQEFLMFNRAADRFELTNDIFVSGNVAASKGLYAGTLSLSGSTTTIHGITYDWPAAPAGFSGQVLQIDPATGQLSWGIPVTFIVKPSDEVVTTSSTVQNDDDFTVYVGPDETWIFQFWLSMTTNTTADFRFALGGQAGSSCEFVMGSTEQATANRSGDCDGAPGSFTFAGASSADFVSGFASYTQGATPGNVTLQWAQSVASSTTTMRAGSFMVARRIR